MNFQPSHIAKRISRLLAAAVVMLSLADCDYMHKVYVRGTVVDVSGQALPGVMVHVSGTESEALTSALGQYSIGAFTGEVPLEFYKTGYAPARSNINVATIGLMETEPVAMWPLPIGEGIYLFQNYRYHQTSHPRPNRYKVKDMAMAFGTPVNPDLVIPWVSPEADPDANPPFMVGHKVPAYDARMYKLRRVNASLVHATAKGGAADKDDETVQYNEEIWIAEKSVPVRPRSVDEFTKQLVELRAAMPLEPGVYAIHWGALDGYDSVEPRIFMFAFEEPEGEGEGEETPEGEGTQEGREKTAE